MWLTHVHSKMHILSFGGIITTVACVGVTLTSRSSHLLLPFKNDLILMPRQKIKLTDNVALT